MKGQGLSITTIVVAAIALLVLVVLVAVFTGQFAGFSEGTRDCSALKDAQCYTSGELSSQPGEWTQVFGRRCNSETTEPEDVKRCYVPAGNKIANPAGTDDE